MENLSIQIINGCVKGNPQYQKILYEENYTRLVKLAFRYVSTYDQAMEFTQIGFLKIFHEFIRFRFDQNVITRDSLSAWIKRVFVITLVDHIKADLELYMPGPIPADIWQEYDRPHSKLEIVYIELIKTLKRLPVQCRMVFNLFVIDGFSHNEIAGMLGITVDHSKQSITDTRKNFGESFFLYKAKDFDFR